MAGFKLAMQLGLLCVEPVRGVMVVLEEAEITLPSKGTREAAKRERNNDRRPSFAPSPSAGGWLLPPFGWAYDVLCCE